VETTVMVRDRSTVVIGGLIDDNFSQTEYKVPCLGDIPGMGWLFKTRLKGNEKSNLFIFITPKVIQNSDEAASILKTKKSKMDNMREIQIKLYQGGRSNTNPLAIDMDPEITDPTGSENDIPSISAGISGTARTELDEGAAPRTPPTGTDDLSGTPTDSAGPQPGESDTVTTGNDAYFLQVQSFADEMNAIEMETRLNAMGYKAQIVETEVENKVWYRIQVGGYPDRASALKAQESLTEKGLNGTLILHKGR
jgi:general secretion pathway protein D